MNEEQINALKADLDGLHEGEIRKRLVRGDYRTDRANFVELYLTEREKDRHLRFTQRDRNIQQWILALAAGSIFATIATWFLRS